MNAELDALYDLITSRSPMSGDAIAIIICVTIICVTVLIWKWWDKH